MSSADCFQHFYKPSPSASYTFNIRNHKPKPEKFQRLKSDFEVAELEMLKRNPERDVLIICKQRGVNGFDLCLFARPTPNMGGPAVISIHAWTESRDQHQTLLRELSIDEGEIEKFTAVQNYGLAMCIRRTLYYVQH